MGKWLSFSKNSELICGAGGGGGGEEGHPTGQAPVSGHPVTTLGLCGVGRGGGGEEGHPTGQTHPNAYFT